MSTHIEWKPHALAYQNVYNNDEIANFHSLYKNIGRHEF